MSEPSAAILPQVIVTTERIPSATNQIAEPSLDSGLATINNIRIKPTIPIALLAVANIPATGEFAPAYASGAAKWNGAALTLKPNPTNTNPSAINGNAGEPCGLIAAAKATDNSPSWSEPAQR